MRLAAPTLLCILASCGGGSSDDGVPPAAPGPLVFDTGALVDGAVWQLNRPIDVRFDRPMDFDSVSLASIAVETAAGGTFPLGTWGPGADPTTGAADARVVRFQPACPSDASLPPFGLQPDTAYRLVVRGADTAAAPLRAIDGTELVTGTEVAFRTPPSPDPAQLYFDPRPGPPVPVVRGRGAVPLDDGEATRIELGHVVPATVHLQDSGFGGLAVAPESVPLVVGGLPLNHHLESEHRVALVVEFDQPIQPTAANLERIGLEHLDGTWRPVPCRAELVATCGRRGSTVRVTPLGTLPPAMALRLRLDDGFADLVGEQHQVPWTELLPVEGTADPGPRGARVDGLLETFTVGGDGPGSMEDTTSDLGAPRAAWGGGVLTGIAAPGGLSRARSRWFHLGLAGAVAGLPPVEPRLSFLGTDAAGRIQRSGTAVVLGPPALGPLAASAVETFTVRLALADLAEPTGLYLAQPALLRGVRVRLRPDPAAGWVIAPQALGAGFDGVGAALHLGPGCYIPGIPTDCVPWDLGMLFPAPPATTVEITPQCFEVYTFTQRDTLMPDHRVTIRFQATRALANGQPDPAATSPWVVDPAGLAPGPWTHLRFEVDFELDVSGDGYDPLERSPRLDFLKVPVDLRR